MSVCSKAGVVCLLLAALVCAAEPTAAQLYRQGRKAERAGDIVQAYLLYSEAAAREPRNAKYSRHADAIRTDAAMQVKPMPKELAVLGGPGAAASTPAPPAAPPATPPPPGFSTVITEDDLAEVRRLSPPPQLKPAPVKRDLNLHGSARVVMEQVAQMFGLQVVFDGDYGDGPQVRLQVSDVDYREALRAAEAATDSFVVPLGELLILAVKDTPQKRLENEPTMAVTIPIPYTVSAQDAQELGRSVQQTMEIQKLAIDTTRRMVLIRDRVSRVLPAKALFEQLAHGRAQVMIEMRLIEVDRSRQFSYGATLPDVFPLMYFGANMKSVQSLASLFAGHPAIGIGIATANLLATMSNSDSTTLFESDARSVDGAAASFHIGNKYPVQTAGFLGSQSNNGLDLLSSFTYEDLGLVLKVTPRVHGTEDVSLEVEAEYKALTGQSENGIPVISSRSLHSKVRIAQGEWAVVGGMLSTSEAKTITGTAGISSLPGIGRLLQKNVTDDERTEVLVLMRPILLDPSPDDSLTRRIWIGSDARLAIPL